MARRGAASQRRAARRRDGHHPGTARRVPHRLPPYPRLRSIAARRVHQITTDPQIRVLPHSDQSFQAGFALYQARPDKRYSLTDCISMHMMQQEGITGILTHDNHFTQEGFTVLR
jgi:predicted nucleic acid-binding protein